MDIISHINLELPEDNQIQSNEDHCHGVAMFARDFADEFGFGAWGYVMGMLHDKGKEKQSFQDYIRLQNGLPSSPLNGRDKSHAYVGALLAKKIYGSLSELMINPIAGHHAGLYDYTELANIISKSIPTEIDCNIEKKNLSVEILKNYANENHAYNHLIRMLYSCLVDADFLDTERFMNRASFLSRKTTTTMEQLQMCLCNKLKQFESAPNTFINNVRRQIQNKCFEASSLPSGFFSLTVPTGGGKTISSIVWAVNHAIRNGKKRIIIAIPYTSIIVQTASILKDIFGEDNVLEHYNNIDFENIENELSRHRMKLATENWNAPIVVTTNVQLFESIYSNKPSACRKLHNICNSILILDEVQTLPTDFLQPIVDALRCYQKHFGLSVLFTTASQPILNGIIEGCNPKSKFKGLDSIYEIIPKGMNLHEKLRRVKLTIDNNGRSYDEIADQLSKHDKVLCIVNTRRDAKEIYERLPDEGIKLHLSRMMCPAHVKSTISFIKSVLQQDNSKIIRVIATQLIEAGVDIDFPVVYRQEAGLDSILQAAGRCNREGKYNICTAYVFSLSKEHPLYGESLKDANYARLNILGEKDWFAPETMTEYFNQYYSRRETFDKKQIKSLLYDCREMCFETAAKAFRLIDDKSIPVVVNWEHSIDIIEQLTREKYCSSYSIVKSLGQYIVSVKKHDFDILAQTGSIEEIVEGIYVIKDKLMYNEKVGLLTSNHWLEETIII